MFTKTSRYYGLKNLVHESPSGREVVYKERRLIQGEPPIRGRVPKGQSERLDLLAARHLGNAELYWRLLDVNRALDPAELEHASGVTVAVPDV